MLEKLFVRVRSWLHIDPSAATTTGTSGGVAAGLTGPALAPTGAAGSNGFTRSGSGSANGTTTRQERHRTPPPPMPGEAFGDSGELLALSMEAQPESGMVITESGIIIIDPNADEAKQSKPISSGAQAVTADTSWAVPNLVKPAGPNPGVSSSSDWDAVLARARAQLTTPPPAPGPGKPRK